MVGPVEGDEALWVPGGLKDLSGILDSDNLIARSMQDEQGPAKDGGRTTRRVCSHVKGYET
jgi:hypothetical protein